MFEKLRVNLGLACLLPALVASALSGCAPSLDGTTALSRQAIYDEVNKALDTKDCSSALMKIESLYNSGYGDNTTRMYMASVYGCFAGVNVFKNIGDIADNSAILGGSGFWGLLPRLYPSTTDDRAVEGAGFASDALMAALKPGWLTVPGQMFNLDTPNPGSTAVNDRIMDSNLYLIFVSMAGVGALQNRYGAPDENFLRTTPLPWNTVSTLDEDGCHYAASVLNLMDGLEATADALTGNLQSNLKIIQTAFSTAVDAACSVGCRNVDPPASILDPTRDWGPSGCPVTTDCWKCPQALRDRRKCVADTTGSQQLRCAAAGIVNFVNYGDLGWQNP